MLFRSANMMMKAGLLAATLLFTALGGAHGATCGDKDGSGGGAVTDAECRAANTGSDYDYVYDSDYSTTTCSNDPCSGSDLTIWCCEATYNTNYNTNTGLGGDECDSAKTWYTMVTTFSYVGALIAIVGIVFGCLPTCCGKMKDKKKLTGWLAIGIGVLALVLPAIVSSVMVESAISKYCDDCAYVTCTEETERQLKDDLHALGMFVAYTFALGFVPAILGIISISMGSATLCGCCGAKPGAAGAAAASGVVVMATPAAK